MKNKICGIVLGALVAFAGSTEARGQCEGGVCRPRAVRERSVVVHRDRERSPVRSVVRFAVRHHPAVIVLRSLRCR